MHLSNGKGNTNLWVILVVFLEVAIVLVIFRVVEERNPLLVFMVLDNRLVEEVLLEGQANRAEERIIVQILHNDANHFLRLGVPKRNHDGVRLLEIAAVNEFHISVDVESHFFFVLIVELPRFEVDVKNSNV